MPKLSVFALVVCHAYVMLQPQARHARLTPLVLFQMGGSADCQLCWKPTIIFSHARILRNVGIGRRAGMKARCTWSTSEVSTAQIDDPAEAAFVLFKRNNQVYWGSAVADKGLADFIRTQP